MQWHSKVGYNVQHLYIAHNDFTTLLGSRGGGGGPRTMAATSVRVKENKTLVDELWTPREPEQIEEWLDEICTEWIGKCDTVAKLWIYCSNY